MNTILFENVTELQDESLKDLSLEDILSFYMETEARQEKFAIAMCNYLTDNIVSFWDQHKDNDKVYVYFFFDSQENVLKFILDLDAGKYDDTFYIELTRSEFVSEQEPGADTNIKIKEIETKTNTETNTETETNTKIDNNNTDSNNIETSSEVEAKVDRI